MNPHPPQLCIGQVMHARLPRQRAASAADANEATVANAFTYPLCFVSLPLDAPPPQSLWFATARRALMRVAASDHGARDGSAPAAWARQQLVAAGIDSADGALVLQTFPRIFGLLFNPVSFWFCHDAGGALRAVIAEVNNTFGERHNYLVAHPDQRPITPTDRISARKLFHVSPFFPVAGEYRFRFDITHQRRRVEIDYWLDGERALVTALEGRCQPLDATSVRRALFRFPLLALGVLWRIHWQALRLWFKGAFFFRKPVPPLQETTR